MAFFDPVGKGKFFPDEGAGPVGAGAKVLRKIFSLAPTPRVRWSFCRISPSRRERPWRSVRLLVGRRCQLRGRGGF